MINQVKINFQQISKAVLEPAPSKLTDYNNAYKKLTSIISDLNQRSENYCIVIQIINGPVFTDNSQLTRQFESLIQCLTNRELEIFDLAFKGFTNRLIAETLFISVETVRSHRKKIVSKAGVRKIEDIKNWLLDENKLITE